MHSFIFTWCACQNKRPKRGCGPHLHIQSDETDQDPENPALCARVCIGACMHACLGLLVRPQQHLLIMHGRSPSRPIQRHSSGAGVDGFWANSRATPRPRKGRGPQSPGSRPPTDRRPRRGRSPRPRGLSGSQGRSPAQAALAQPPSRRHL